MYVGWSGCPEMDEVRSTRVEDGVERMEGAEMIRLWEVNIDEMHKYLVDKL